MEHQQEIIQSSQAQPSAKLAPTVPNPLKSQNITFENDFGKKPLLLAHLTRDQGMIAILSFAGAFVGAAVGGIPLCLVILATGFNDIKYAGIFDDEENSTESKPLIEQETIELASLVVEDKSLPQPENEGETTVAVKTEIIAQNNIAQAPRLADLKSLPLPERVLALLKRLEDEHFNLSRCIKEQITCICGNQRGGKGTLMALLAILSKAIEKDTLIHYFTAGDDIYPFKCDRLVCRLSYLNLDGDEADAKVAQELYNYLKQMDNATQGEYSNIILVIDEAVALSDYLDPEQKQWMIRFLLTRANKKGAQIFIVLHGINLTSWVGTGNTSGFSSTFKTGATFIGCEATSIKIHPLRSISVATGHYFLASPDDFSKPLPDGELGTIPDWLKSEINPTTQQPDPARTLLNFFPELKQEWQVIEQNPSTEATLDAQPNHSLKEKETLLPELKLSDTLSEPLRSIWLYAKKKNDWITSKDVYKNEMAALKGKNIKQIRQYLGLLADTGYGEIDEEGKSDSSVGFRAY